MVGYAYDLGPRHSSRIIEQAVRQKAPVWIETIEQIQPRAYSGSLLANGPEGLTFGLTMNSPGPVPPITGQYYQIMISLGETRYLTVSDLVEVQQHPEGPHFVFTQPKAVQVMQRRKFHRQVPGQSFPVFLTWKNTLEENTTSNTPAMGQIRDLSLHGMAVQVSENLDGQLFIGDVVYLRFSLSVREPELITPATVCHKDLRKGRTELILGLQFVDLEESGDFQTRLRSVLAQHDLFSKDTKKGI